MIYTVITSMSRTKCMNEKRQKYDGNDLLFYIQIGDALGVIELLKEKKLNVNSPLLSGQTLLVIAVLFNNAEIVKYLLSIGADPCVPGIRAAYGWTPQNHIRKPLYALQAAIDNKNPDIVLTLLKSGGKLVWHCTASIKDVLTLAIATDHRGLLEWLLSYVHENDEDKYAMLSHSLIEAIRQKNVPFVQLLLSNSANVNRIYNNMLPIVVAAENCNLDMCNLLIENGVSLHDQFQINPLSVAINCGSVQAVKYLIGKHCDVTASVNWTAYDEVTKRCLTPGSSMLHLAVFKRNVDICKLLIHSGASVNCEDATGNTPLHLACENCPGNVEVLEYLLTLCRCEVETSPVTVFCRRKVKEENTVVIDLSDKSDTQQKQVLDISVQNKSGHTPLIFAIINGNYEAARLLLEEDLDLTDSRQCTALHHAVKTGQGSLVSLLVNNPRCSVNLTDDSGCTPLHLAVRMSDFGIADILLTAGARCKVKTHGGHNLLYEAVVAKCQKLVECFLDVGLNIDARTKGGETALMSAARSEVQICELLVQRGANLNLRDRNQGETALSQAVYFGIEENAQLLIREGADINLSDKRGTTPLYWSIFNARIDTLILLVIAGVQLTCQQFETKYPVNLTVKRNKELSEWIIGYLSGVRQLQEACRKCIRHALIQHAAGRGIGLSVNELILPKSLKQYIMYRKESEFPFFK